MRFPAGIRWLRCAGDGPHSSGRGNGGVFGTYLIQSRKAPVPEVTSSTKHRTNLQKQSSRGASFRGILQR
ncbi:hypothetical protein PAMP_016714 [Pampus punctatissimus]